MNNFEERPQLNERQRALKYLKKLIDKASIDKHNNQEDIRELMEIQKLVNRKKYGLVWEEHEEKVDQEMKTKIPVFIEDKNKMINGNKSIDDYNFLLVGDNLHSLHLLQKTHLKRINVIYIDPPYNTERKDFKYNDSFVDSSDEFIHSKWLSFMHRRLKLAKKLLSSDGVIMISIDNNEYANLKLLMDQLFPNGYVTTLHVEMSTVQGMKVKSAKKGGIVRNGEYILIYSKDGHKNVMKHPLYNSTSYDKHYNQFIIQRDGYYDYVPLSHVLQTQDDIISQLKLLGLVKNGKHVANTKLDIYYSYSTLVKDFINSHADFIVRDHTSIDIPSPEKYDNDKIYHYNNGQRNYLIQKKNNGKFTQKIQLSTKLGYSDDFKSEYAPLKIRGDWWKDFYLDMGNISKEGGVKLSSGKKPLRLIEQLLSATSSKNDIILDFFAGSGTTGQAVIDLNKKDGGNRKFILSTNNEGNIAEKITYQRMTNVNSGYSHFPANHFNLKYFNTGFISKDDDELESNLLSNVNALIELRHGINLRDSNISIVTNRSQVSKLNLNGINTVYMRGRVHLMMSPMEQERYFTSNINIIDIPDSFFRDEIQEWI